jgi:hypothetical protein
VGAIHIAGTRSSREARAWKGAGDGSGTVIALPPSRPEPLFTEARPSDPNP